MDLLFTFLFPSILAAALLVVFSAHPIHSVLSLILVFCFSSMLLLLVTIDFFAFLLIIVYVGAIAVLFLFVIMMLNIKVVQLTESFVRWIFLVLLVGLAIAAEVFYGLNILVSNQSGTIFLNSSWDTLVFGGNQVKFVGEVLYSYYFVPFILSGLVLLTALVGAIILTVGAQRDCRRQQIYKQVGRREFGSITFYN